MITSFEFKDNDADWQLDPFKFDGINLLVGLSGVGKSRILRAIRACAHAGSGRDSAPRNCDWKLSVIASDQEFTWSATTGNDEVEESRIGRLANENLQAFVDIPRRSGARYVTEVISDKNGNDIATRTGDDVRLGNRDPMKLKDTESIISLLQKEQTIAPLFVQLSRVFLSRVTDFEFPIWTRKRLAQLRRDRELHSLEKLREAVGIPLIVRFYLLQTLEPIEYTKIIDSFKDIFETVNDVRVGFQREIDPDGLDDDESDSLTVVIDEEGVTRPIELGLLSSGMRRTLRHLVEIALSPRGAMLLIDEYENSMGVNCLPSVTQHLLNSSREVQVVATSHHPYVINNIDVSHWKLVTRHGGHVHVRDSKEIPELQTASKQEAFLRLINSAAYRDGVMGL